MRKPKTTFDKTPVAPLTRAGRSFISPRVEVGDFSENARVAELLEGRCTLNSIGLDLQIHANDTLEMKSGHASFDVPPALTVALMLEGDLDASLDGRPLAMTAQGGPAGYLWVHRRPARLERWIRAGQRVRKITIGLPVDASPGILGAAGDDFLMSLSGLGEELTILRWQPSPQALRSAEEILALDCDGDSLQRLSSSIAALTVVRNALTQLDDDHALPGSEAISTRDVTRARRARDFILANIQHALPIKEVAQRTGMSVSTLQRVFKACFGTTVNEFVRVRRLELARMALLEGGLTVGEAAYDAGYSSAANFSTAFQRAFGYPPSACIHG